MAGPKTIPWDELKAEFLQSRESLHAFRLRKNIKSLAWFYKKVKDGQWEADRRKIHQKAIQKIASTTTDALAKRWSDYSQLWGAVKAQAAAVLRATRKSDGTIRPLDTRKLQQLASAIEIALKSERLIAGENTGDERAGGDINVLVLQHLQSQRDRPGVFRIPAKELDDPGPTSDREQALADSEPL